MDANRYVDNGKKRIFRAVLATAHRVCLPDSHTGRLSQAFLEGPFEEATDRFIEVLLAIFHGQDRLNGGVFLRLAQVAACTLPAPKCWDIAQRLIECSPQASQQIAPLVLTYWGEAAGDAIRLAEDYDGAIDPRHTLSAPHSWIYGRYGYCPTHRWQLVTKRYDDARRNDRNVLHFTEVLACGCAFFVWHDLDSNEVTRYITCCA